MRGINRAPVSHRPQHAVDRPHAANQPTAKTGPDTTAVSLLALSHHHTGLPGLITIVFTAPFLLFYAVAGWLADRFPRRRVIIASKVMELIFLSLGGVGIMTLNWPLIVVVIFLMAVQATIFGPALNGCIPAIHVSLRWFGGGTHDGAAGKFFSDQTRPRKTRSRDCRRRICRFHGVAGGGNYLYSSGKIRAVINCFHTPGLTDATDGRGDYSHL